MLTDVTTDIVITKEKTFSPVAPFYRFKTEQDAVTSSRVLRSRGAAIGSVFCAGGDYRATPVGRMSRISEFALANDQRRWDSSPNVRFAGDSPLEDRGFELPVPPEEG